MSAAREGGDPMHRVFVALAFVLVLAACVATAQPSHHVDGTFETVDVRVPGEGQVRKTLTVVVPEAVLRELTSFVVTVHTELPTVWDTAGEVDTADGAWGARVVEVEVDGDHPSMTGAVQVTEGTGRFVNVGGPVDACAPHADCTLVYTLIARTTDPRDVPLTWTVMARADVAHAVDAIIGLSLDPR